MMSIIIPAFNEADGVARLLRSILADARTGEFEIIVVCNGCTDKTAEVARLFLPNVTVVESPTASKIHALNLGDGVATGFPRFYVDADIVVDTQTLRSVAERLSKGDVLLCSPVGDLIVEGSSWLVRQYYAVRSRLPSAREGNGGSGIYAMSESGRCRFEKFPDVVADDTYVRFLFRPEERATLLGSSSAVFPPRSLASLIAVRTRLYFGMLDLRRNFRNFYSHDSTANASALLSLVRFPSLWAGLLIYIFVNVLARLRAHRRSWLPAPGAFAWQRDETSRSARS